MDTHTYTHTYIHTYTQDNYSNPRCACTPRVNEQKVGMLLQKRTDTRVGISSMRKSIYLLTTTPSSHTHRFHPLPLAHTRLLFTTPIHSTHSPQLSSILLTFHKLKVWMTIVESGWNVWVWLVGVVRKRMVWLVGVGGIYGCGYWVWL